MEFVDYYTILGINKLASQKDIKSAYRKLARNHHPDLHPEDKEAKLKFQEINEANEVLSNPEKRKKYDQYGKDWQHPQQFDNQYKENQHSARNRQSAYSGSQSESGFSDFFESIFGGNANSGRGRQARYKGEDYSAGLHLELTDAYRTHKQTLSVNGKNIRITIPAGIEDGQTIKIPGYGGMGLNGGPNGDLIISFSIDNNTNFKRVGNNIYLSVNLNLYIAVLGGEITVDTLDGKVKLKVAPETQNGSKVKLKGKGFPVYKKEGHFGDLYIEYFIEIPTKLTSDQKELFMKLSLLNQHN